MIDTPRQRLRLTRALVDLLPENVPDLGPIDAEEAALGVDYHERTADAVMKARPDDGALWVFAIGSLIWKPRCDYIERRWARVDGWHRAFCLGMDTRYRGNPDAPGLMLSLDCGGSVEGAVFRLNPQTAASELLEIIRTEPPEPPVWVNAHTREGRVSAIAFVCPQDFRGYQGHFTPDEVADYLSHAVGMLGSMPDYLLQTVEHLEEAGIHDPYLWDMQDRVAARLEARLTASQTPGERTVSQNDRA